MDFGVWQNWIESKLNILTPSFHNFKMELIKSPFIIRLLLGLNGILNIKYFNYSQEMLSKWKLFLL